MRRRNKPQPWNNKAPLKALAAVLLVGALVVAVRQQTHNEWESSESTTSEALRALRAADARARDAEAKAADADHALHEVRHTASTRNELNQALRARAQAADAAAAAAEAREQASDARAKAAERRAAQAEAALRASATRPLVKRTGPFRHVRVQAPGAPLTYPPGQRPSWMTQVDCSAYDYSCASSRMRGAYEAYPMHRPPGEISDTLSLDSDGGAAFRKRVLERLVATNAPAAAPSRRWWLAATASDEGAVQVSKDPETTRRALEASRLTSLDDRLQAAVSSEGAVPGSTVLPAPLSKRLAWTMMDKKYAHDMLFDVAHMARHVAGFEKLVVVALDEPTTRACAAGSISAASAGASATRGVQTSGRMKGVSNALVEVVQGAKFKASLWFVQKGYDFVFFEADVWFTKSVDVLWSAAHRDVVTYQESRTLPLEEVDLYVAAHQNNPTYTNIGVYAARATDASREFFSGLLEEMRLKPGKHDQLLFHNLLTWHRMKPSQPVPGDWGDAPKIPRPTNPAAWAFIDNHQGVASTHPIITQDTAFVHTLGNVPLDSQEGKKIQSKELGAWHGLGSPPGTPSYYGASAHDGRTKYLALDGSPLNGISLCERGDYHNGRVAKARVAVLLALAAHTGRVLLLPRVVVDYHQYFLWTFLDLKSVGYGVEWRETNFPSNPRSWKNGTHAFGSTARVSLQKHAVGTMTGAGPRWAAPPKGGALADLLAAALKPHDGAELLLVDLAFADERFVSTLANCESEQACERRGIPWELVQLYRKLRWCGQSIDLERLAAKSFQGWDCFGKGRAPPAV